MRPHSCAVPAVWLVLVACSGESGSTSGATTGGGLPTGGLGAAPGSGSSSPTGGSAMGGGGALPTGGLGALPATGGVAPTGGAASGATPGTGATLATGATGGATGGGGAIGTGAAGAGAFGTGGAGAGGAGTGAAGTGGTEPDPGYALPPPDPCSNRFSVPDCLTGDSSSACGGICPNDHGPTAKNACESGKEGVPVQFACKRDMLFSSEMSQAAIDDGYEGAFHYAIVGHDPDPSNLDAGLPNSCCQCYQLVFDVPTYLTASVLTPPPPLIVQSANTAASGALGFDVFMAAGGLGAFNACHADLGLASSQGYSQYTSYPSIGQPGAGGVKPGPDSVNCTDRYNNLTDALIADAGCQERIEAACNEIAAANPEVEEDTRHSCVQSNQAATYYHENWNVYARRVACPAHLMEVTGCKIAVEAGLPAPDPAVQTAAQAAAAGFSSGYHTTTMQDCCMPTCAWADNVQVETVDGYDSFYSCLEDGTVVTE